MSCLGDNTRAKASMYFFYYYPVGTDAGRPRWPWVTLLLMLSMVALFLVSVPFASEFAFNFGPWIYRPAIADSVSPLTAIFLHVGWIHLLGNLLYLWVFGPTAEKALGRLGALLFFLGCGYLGNLWQGVWAVHLRPDLIWTGVVGASGSISGLLGFFMVRFPWARVKIAWWAFLPLQGINRTGAHYMPGVFALAIWVLLQVALALVGRGGTAYGAHLGGLITGIVLALATGQHRQASREREHILAKRALVAGQVHTAAGHFERYLQRYPWDEDVQLEFARVLSLLRRRGRAIDIFRKQLGRHLQRDEVGEACGLWAEARRGLGSFALPPLELRRLASILEKQGDYEGAVEAWLDLGRFHGDQPELADHARVRAATLLLRKVGDIPRAHGILEDALEKEPEGPWADYLREELRRLNQGGFAA